MYLAKSKIVAAINPDIFKIKITLIEGILHLLWIKVPKLLKIAVETLAAKPIKAIYL